jgi:hypothetical protein
MKKVIFTAFAVGLGLTASLMAQVPNYVPKNGLVGWWPFNGNANDESGNGNNGTVNGATLTADRFGNLGKAYNFDGNSKIICDAPNIPVSNSSRTLTAWLKWSALQTIWDNRVLNYGSCPNFSNNGSYGITIWDISGNGNPNNSTVVLYGCGAGDLVTNNILDTNWHLIVGTYDGVFAKIYVDNMLLQKEVRSFNTTFSNLVFGANENVSVNSGNYNGKLDDIGIWNRALTDQEISDLYNANICYEYVSVTDTLVINTGITGYNPITYLNTLKIWPNPTNDHITIDAGNLTTMNGYSIKIEDAQGKQVFQNALNQKQFYIDITTWGGNGLYFVRIIDPQGNTVDIKKIVLQ